MKNDSLLGPWIRRFLLEHLVAERNLSRNTQRSYRDTLCLLLPCKRQSNAPVRQAEFCVLCSSWIDDFLRSLSIEAVLAKLDRVASAQSQGPR